MNVFDLAAKISLNSKEYEDGLAKASQKMNSFGKKVKSGLAGAMKVGTAAVAGTAVAVSALGAAFIKGAKDTASYADNIDKMSQKMGVSAKGFQEWDFILQHCGTSMETMKASMKTLATAAETGNKAFEQLGITQEQIKELNQEELFAKTISALQNVEDETQRTYLAGQLLGRGATELGAVLNMTAEETEELRKQVSALGGVLSNDAVKAGAQFQDSLQNLQVSVGGIKNKLMSEFLPSLSTVMDGLSLIFSGQSGGVQKINEGIDSFAVNLNKALPKVFEVGTRIVESLLFAIVDNLPSLVDMGVNVITSLVEGIDEKVTSIMDSAVTVVMTLVDGIMVNLPMVLNIALKMIKTLAEGLSQHLPTMIPAVVAIVLELAEKLTSPESLTEIINAALLLIVALADGLLEALPMLIEKAPIIIDNLLSAISQLLPEVIQKGVEVVVKLAGGIIKAIPDVVKAGGQIAKSYISSIKGYFSNMVDLGKQAVGRFGNGIKSAVSSAWTWGKDLMQNFIDGITSKWKALRDKVASIAQTVKDFIGFSEPKKGPLSNFHTYAPDMIDLFTKGIDDNKYKIERSMSQALNFNTATMSGAFALNSASLGNVTNNFYGEYSERDSAKFVRSINRRLGAEFR